ncbi:MAG: DUF4143 domain-containing protein [Mycobacteriales bacterium]|nr:DUF4143 domain-containing protein [Mycobacteriales bacterium]
MSELPATMVVGPRATGKTTTARRHVASVVRLDRPAEAVAFAADPDAALAAFREPVLLDEWQSVPDVLGAVKRAVDDDARPGRFLLTGSVRADFGARTWPGTGRVTRLAMYGLTVREQQGNVAGEGFLDVLARGEIDALALPDPLPDLIGYVELALGGGFPEAALRSPGPARRAWLDGYLEQLLTRDAALLGSRSTVRLRRYFEALALSSAGVADHRTLYEAAGIDRRTAVAYDDLLAGLHVAEEAPAWLSNRLSRLVKGGKRYVVDPALIGAALHLDVPAVLGDGDLLGRLLDTFVAAQLRPEVALSDRRPRLHHLREKNGRHEVDLLVEGTAGTVVALEVKATAAPTRRDGQHLAWLRDELGDRFLCGAVLHTGSAVGALGERVFALPIAAIWGPRKGV